MGGDDSTEAATPLPPIGEAAGLPATTPQYVAELDRDGTIVALSGAPSGYTVAQFVGTKIGGWVVPYARAGLEQAIADAFAAGESRSFAWVGRTSGLSFESRVTPVWRDGSIVHAVLMTQDVTERHRLERERKEIEEQMRQAQKLESLGMLAGGIAHDFNNVLMAVLANAELALAAHGTPGDSTSHLDDIRSAAMQGRELTRQLLNYAAQGPLTNQPVDLSELVRDTVALIGVSISKKAELSLQLAAQASVVEGDSGQLRQLIMNLVINASEALGDGPGQIEIQIAPVEVTASDLENSSLIAEIGPGRAVMLRVRDTGRGMDEETQRRIFDPFFTTKPTGRGLGLASALNVVRGHRGAMRVRSEPGSGTEFTVWLMRSEQQAAARASALQVGPSRTSRGLALVVDDEPMLRTAARKSLLGLGFDVIVAEDGQSALQRFDEHAGQLVLVLLDLTMPKLSGLEVLRRMREREKTLPVLCTSGYSSAFVSAELASDSAARFLAKPYSFAELKAVIDILLNA